MIVGIREEGETKSVCVRILVKADHAVLPVCCTLSRVAPCFFHLDGLLTMELLYKYSLGPIALEANQPWLWLDRLFWQIQFSHGILLRSLRSRVQNKQDVGYNQGNEKRSEKDVKRSLPATSPGQILKHEARIGLLSRITDYKLELLTAN